MQAVVSEFKGYEEAVRAFPVEFEEDAVVLKIRQKGSSSVDIPYPEGLDLKGWTVTSDSPLDVRVDTFYVTCCQTSTHFNYK